MGTTAQHLLRALGITLALALPTAWAGSRTAPMTVGVTIDGSCTVSTDTTGSPGVACSTGTVQPQIDQRVVLDNGQSVGQAGASEIRAAGASSQHLVTVVTY
ncbi:hypothetical protein [Burkholderia anthina]|uniref:hypothetical protein n=1 Tax=Burkholderia anthina TaxID=179879 RepID=UPI0037C0CB59